MPTVFSETGSPAEETRAEFIRAHCAGAPESFTLFESHAWRWAGLPAPPTAWRVDARPLFEQFDRGVLTRLRLHTDSLARLSNLRLLFATEPVGELSFEVGAVGRFEAVAVRTLLFPRPLRVAVSRQWHNDTRSQDAFLGSLLSSPLLAFATALTLDGVNWSRTAAPLVGWLAKSPFLGEVTSLNLARNRFHVAEARDLLRLPNLWNVRQLTVSGNPLGEPGLALLRRRFGAGLTV